ncbi:MAG: rhodanese-like domain-containing protein, partial [Kangiellaceae bacterium]
MPDMNELDVNKIFQTAIIDLRSNIQFNKQHLKFSCNITLSELEERIHELPDKRKLVSIIGEKLDLSPAEILLRSKGYTI